MWIEAEPVYGALVSLAIGLIIGLERGWQVRQLGDNQRIAGMRTYGLIGLLGGVCALLLPGLGPWLPLLGLLAVVAGCGLSVWLAQRWQGEFGLTSSVAMVLTYLLGLMSVLQSPREAVACAVLAALLMGLKGKIQQGMLFLSKTEFHATLRFLLISLVLLPVLPDAEMGPLNAFNPFKIWLMVVVIAGISFSGHFAVRLLGTRAGLVLTSMLAGLASSTALTLQFARLNKAQPGLERLLATGILLAGATMWLRLLVLVLLIHNELALRLALPLLLLAATVYAFAFWFWRQREEMSDNPVQPETSNPLDLATAIKFGLLLALIGFMATLLQSRVGDSGVYLLALVSGITDVDAITLSLSQLAHKDLALEVAARGILLAGLVNSLVKGLLALVIGGRRLGMRVMLPYLVSALLILPLL
ncbi:MgtC/SapB family protein [Aeromonas encheleia]|uniref:MgtC/SapB family protein n=1 Tax=Aeromonas encheleia TaxID=73010 RepID=UPI001F5979D1|nr:MgtC/SapB family protein [Aeromonas encheleia]UNP88999.1 MgtC/SapB family protein [Aeromonas encheleia]